MTETCEEIAPCIWDICLGYLNDENLASAISTRRQLLQGLGTTLLMGGVLPPIALGESAQRGFRGKGRMDMSTGEDWIDTFFTGGADAIIHYYADNFVFEDITLFQTIDNKEDLHRAFVPFNNAGPDSPAGVHQFDVIPYDGGLASDRKRLIRAASCRKATRRTNGASGQAMPCSARSTTTTNGWS